MKTKEEIEYKAAPYGRIATIPKGTAVIPADNLPIGGFWVQPWPGMDEQADGWMRNYGFLLFTSEVTQ